jgi:hypothetical protein
MGTISEKIELALIPLLGIVFWLIAPLLPGQLNTGYLLLSVSALLLFQSLVRDLFLLAEMKREPQPIQYRAARCMCLESTVGMTGILVGTGVLGFGINMPVVLNKWVCSILVMLTLATGFLIKDFVIETSPWRILRDRKHVNILFKWGK